MTFAEVMRALWRRKLVVVAVAVLIMGASAWFVSQQPRVYESSSTVAFLPDSDNVSTLPVYLGLVDGLLPTYSQLVDSRSFLDDVAEQLPSMDGGDLKSAVSASRVADAGALRISARADTGAEAQAIATAVSDAFVVALSDNDVFVVEIIDQPRRNDVPVAPRPTLVLAAAAVVALALAAAAGLGWERLFGRINTGAELAEAGGVPLIGVLPNERSLRDGRRIVVGDAHATLLDENLRSIRTNLLFSGGDKVGVLLITGLSAGDGKSTVTSNLAVITAELGLSVLVIDGDVHKPTQHQLFNLGNDRGLSSTVLEGAAPADVIQDTAYPGVRVVTAGPPLVSRAQELSLYLQHLPTFGKMADVVLVDSPPLSAADEVRLLGAFAGGVVLLARAGAATARQVSRAVDSMQVLGANVVGLVLTRATQGFGVDEVSDYYRYRQDGGNSRQSQSLPAVEREV